MTNTHWYQSAGLHACYGEEEGNKIIAPYKKKPTVVVAMMFGTQSGFGRMVGAIEAKFAEHLKRGKQCMPESLPDQPVINQLFYSGKFGDAARTVRYGEGPGLSVRHD